MLGHNFVFRLLNVYYNLKCTFKLKEFFNTAVFGYTLIR